MSERPKFYSSNLITLHNPNNNNYYYPDGIRLKYITEQVVLEKSTSSFENKGKMRSYSWSKYSSVNKESDQCESTNNTKKEDEYKEPDSGRPSDCEFNIPFDDIKLVDCLLKGERKAIYKGYWHGEVDVHIFENLSRLERRRFWQDVTRLMMTRHENIALFMGVCVEPPNFAIVTSSCTGVSLYTKLHIKREKLSHSIRLHLLRQIANAITYLHSRTNPIVVRRLSSKNIFLRPKMNLYLTDYSTEDCDYQVPGFVPIQLDCIKYIAPELLLTVEEDIIKLCGETYGCCGGGGGSSAGGGSTSQMPIEWNDDPGETTTTTTHLYPAVKSEQTSKQPILGYIMKLSNPSSELHMTDNNATQDSEILKSWPNLLGLGKNHQSTGSSSSSSTSQLTKKSISLPNLYTNRHTLEDSLKLPYKSVKYISLHKASFIKAIRQFCTTSKQYKIVVKTIYIPVTEFTTSTDIFAFGTIIFELNTRCYPFEEFDICEYIQYLRAGERDEGGEHCIPRSVKNLMQSCWSGDPTKRPSMNTISQELVRSHILYKRQNSDPVPKRSTRYPVNGF
uniref:Protein kinase domain-containing protein n=1 Tax=Trichobilharzia regenti TaxID=157069 RepID=A0AA85JM49_TRIRE|nr:unnamed protein product [Trichobilharzia regenti]